MLHVKFIQEKKTIKTLSFSGVIWLLQYISPTKGNVSWATLFNYRKEKKKKTQQHGLLWCVKQSLTSGVCLQVAMNLEFCFLPKLPHFMLLITEYWVIFYSRIIVLGINKFHITFFGLVLRIYSFVIIHGNFFWRKKKKKPVLIITTQCITLVPICLQ